MPQTGSSAIFTILQSFPDLSAMAAHAVPSSPATTKPMMPMLRLRGCG
jgi:hypothetical protein